MNYNKMQRQTLLQIAHQSLAYGLEHQQVLPIDTNSFEESLTKKRASFVTLELYGELRGCIGSLEATMSLIENVANNAFYAGFRDHRFSPVSAAELDLLDLHISVLSVPKPLIVKDETELLEKLEVGVDGLILKDQGYQSTFLPTVWQSLKTPAEFIKRLKLKAGLPANYWSETIRFFNYQTELIKES